MFYSTDTSKNKDTVWDKIFLAICTYLPTEKVDLLSQS